jgi:hypothetical protein
VCTLPVKMSSTNPRPPPPPSIEQLLCRDRLEYFKIGYAGQWTFRYKFAGGGNHRLQAAILRLETAGYKETLLTQCDDGFIYQFLKGGCGFILCSYGNLYVAHHHEYLREDEDFAEYADMSDEQMAWEAVKKVADHLRNIYV